MQNCLSQLTKGKSNKMNTNFLKLLTCSVLLENKTKTLPMYESYITLQGSSFLDFIFYHCREVRVSQFWFLVNVHHVNSRWCRGCHWALWSCIQAVFLCVSILGYATGNKKGEGCMTYIPSYCRKCPCHTSKLSHTTTTQL